MFLLLAYSITIGSVMTPLGNPQNVLIATQSGIKAPFILFIKYLFIPTIINLLVTAYLLIRIYRVGNGEISSILIPREAIVSRRDAAISGIGLLLVVAALIVNDVLALNGLPHVGRIGFIPFVIAAFTLKLDKKAYGFNRGMSDTVKLF
jgi:Na+/H+ antiporter NhaD/arsenite permease-like protein